MAAMWYTSSAQFTNSNIEHIWKDSQLIHTENICVFLGRFWRGHFFSGTGGEAKFVWCVWHTWSLISRDFRAVLNSSSLLCLQGTGTFSRVLDFCFCPQTGWKPFLAYVLLQWQTAGLIWFRSFVAWLWHVASSSWHLGQNWFSDSFRTTETKGIHIISSKSLYLYKSALLQCCRTMWRQGGQKGAGRASM